MLKRLFQQSGVYTLASVVGKASGFVVTVFYVDPAHLSTADFGYFGQLRAVMLMALLVAGAGLPLGILRFATAREVPDRERAAVPATALAIAVVTSLLTVALGWAFAPAIASWAVHDASRADLVRLLALYVGFKTVADVSYQEARRRERPGLYVAMTAGEMVLQTAAVLFFLVVLGHGLRGILEGYLVAAAVLATVATAFLLSNVERRVSPALVRPMVVFGLPLVVSGLAGRFIYSGDRFFVVEMLGPEANAVYEWASQFGGLVNAFLVQSFQMAFTVLGMRALDDGGDAALHRRSFRHFSVLAGGAVLGLALFVNDASRLVTDIPAYADVSGLVLWIAGGFAWYGLYFVTVNVLFAAGRTRAVSVAVVAAALLNAGLNWALIPRFGLGGSAAATFAAYAALAVWTGVEAERTVRARYEWRVPVGLSLFVFGLWQVSAWTEGLPLGPRLAVKAALLALYAPGLLALGVYNAADVAAARAAVRAFRARRAR